MAGPLRWSPALAVVDAGLSLAQRWYSARIGEGLIYDLRTQVFGHVQRMPLAFFTRTQTGALVTRLNNDVIGAQQAFTSTLSGVVSNVVSARRSSPARCSRCPGRSRSAALVLLPLFLLPARWVGRRLQGITREAMQLNAEMSTTMTERFNVVGRAAGQALRPARARRTRRSPSRAGRVRDIGVTHRRCTAGSSSPR